MQKINFILIAFFFLTLFSCNREDVINRDLNTFEPLPTEYFKRSTVIGNVTDENYNPISHAEIKYSEKSIYSDAKGNFQIKNGLFNEDGEVLEVISPDYFTQYAFIKPKLNQITQTSMICQKKDNAVTINSHNNSEESFYNSKLVCKIPKNSFVDKLNNSYEGDLKLYVKAPVLDSGIPYFNPMDGMPESNKGLGLDSLETIVFPVFSMLLSFQAINGKVLNLNNPAIIEVNIDYFQCGCPGEWYLWRFDIDSGIWIAEKSVTYDQQNNKFIFEVQKSGYYILAQYDLPVVTIEGQVTYNDGSPAENLFIEILNNNQNFTSQDIVFTDINGKYFAYVYQNSNIVLRITNCYGISKEYPLGIINTSVTKDIELSADISNTYSVYIDNIYNEGGNIVANGFVGVTDEYVTSEYFPLKHDSLGLNLNLHACFPVLTLYNLDDLPDVKKSADAYLDQNSNFNPGDYPTTIIDDDYIYAKIADKIQIFDSYPWIINDNSGYTIENNDYNEQLVIHFYKDYSTNKYMGQICIVKFTYDGQVEINCGKEGLEFDITEEQDYLTGFYTDFIEYDNEIRKIEGYFKIRKN